MRVTFDVRAPGDALCVLAGDGRAPTFVQRYLTSALPVPSSLTFVAGSPMRSRVVVGAFVATGGRVTGTGHVEASLTSVGTLERSLRVSTCRGGAPTGLGVSPSGTFATLAASPRLSAADFDGDGREELLALAVDGSLAMLDAEDPDAGSRRVSELVTEGGHLASGGDFDGDCRVDLLAAAPTGVLRVLGSDGSSPAPLGPSDVADAAVLELVANEGPRIAIVSASGAASLDPFDGAVRVLGTDPAAHALAFDIDGDGLSDLLTAGGGGDTHLYRGGTSVMDEPGAGMGLLAPVSGPLAAGDVDGDGLDDALLGDGTALFILSEGSGTLASIPFTATFTDLRRIAVGDVDADCIADLVVLDGTTVRYFHGSDASITERTGPGVTALDVVIADVDGDGAREAALLGTGGRVTLWRP